MPRNDRPLALTIAALLAVTLMVLLVAAAALSYRSEFASARAALLARTAADGELLAASLAGPVRAGDRAEIRRLVGVFLQGPEIRAVGLDGLSAPGEAWIWHGDAGVAPYAVPQILPGEGLLMASAALGPKINVRAYAPESLAMAAARASVIRVLAPLAVALLCAVLALGWLAWYLVLRPVRRLQRFAEQTSLEAPAPATLPDVGFHGEVADLRNSLQKMINLLRGRFQALSRSQERFELAVAGSNDGIWDWDLRTDDVYYSARLLALLGFAEAAAFPPVAQSFWQRIHPSDYERFSATLTRHLRNREPNDVQFRIRLADGQYRWFRGRGQAYWDEHGQPVRMCGSLTDIHEQVVAQESLERTRERELRAREEFFRQLLSAHEQERTRIANELHDSIGQSLSLVANRARLALNVAQLPTAAAAHLDSLAQVTAAAIADIRALVQNLRPLHIDQIGLTASLEALLDSWAASAAVELVHPLENVDAQISGSDATHLYRIAQEALNNILKHSGGRRVQVRLENDLHCVRLVLRDDGCGFDPAAAAARRGGHGLTSMSERAKMLGGTLLIDSAPGRGTNLVIELPVTENLYIDPVESSQRP